MWNGPSYHRYLYDLFVDKAVNKNRVPILIACNKSELMTVRSKEHIQSELENEMCVSNWTSFCGSLFPSER